MWWMANTGRDFQDFMSSGLPEQHEELLSEEIRRRAAMSPAASVWTRAKYYDPQSMEEYRGLIDPMSVSAGREWYLSADRRAGQMPPDSSFPQRGSVSAPGRWDELAHEVERSRMREAQLQGYAKAMGTDAEDLIKDLLKEGMTREEAILAILNGDSE